MTVEEAIRGLKNVRKMFEGYKPNEEMFDMAIKSLEAWEKVMEDIAIKSLGEWYVGRTDGKPEDVILTKDVYDIITKHLKEVEYDNKSE